VTCGGSTQSVLDWAGATRFSGTRRTSAEQKVSDSSYCSSFTACGFMLLFLLNGTVCGETFGCIVYVATRSAVSCM
jgi:hypothetical protein